MKKQIAIFGIMIMVLSASAQEPPKGHKPPTLEEKIERTKQMMQKEVLLSTSQLQSVEAAFKKFFVAADQLRKDNPPPPPPPVDPKVKAAFDKLEKERDEAIRKVLSAEQYEKYKTAAKRMQPPPPGEGGKEGPPPPPRQ